MRRERVSEREGERENETMKETEILLHAYTFFVANKIKIASSQVDEIYLDKKRSGKYLQKKNLKQKERKQTVN